MIIKEARIDDRLVHGQVATAWIQQVQAQVILVADDVAAKDEFQKKVLKIACPHNVQLIIKTVDDAVALIEKDTSEFGVLLIVRSPKEAKRLLELGVKPNHWTLGNITARKTDLERVNILKYVYATKEDANNLNAINEAGVKVVAQSVPSEKVYDIIDLLKKADF